MRKYSCCVINVNTQKKYDSLMKELNQLGYKWSDYSPTISKNYWTMHKQETYIFCDKNTISYGDKRCLRKGNDCKEIVYQYKNSNTIFY